ncbi:PhoX family protein [Vannielia litorea]|uniref:Uncharacterized protein n=1 Tax=Vannielia litorea TaxID=1217970 RepID=A0A1N6G4D6_9RHOB|nr:PhoX family phosphatase [Vannielia litorea]SIO02360.1 hypothetical protein SAMN05444002_2193 [Vannielia litorea]
MTDTKHNLSFDDWDEANFPRPAETEFDRVVERALSRRNFLGSVLAFGSGAAVMGTGLLKGSTALAEGHAMAKSRFPFKPIGIATDHEVHVPEGYTAKVLIRWGDPLFSEADGYDVAEGGPAAMSDKVFGENTDGMELFSYQGHEIIAVNSEYTNNDVNLPAAQEGVPANADDVLKLQQLQGVTVMEVAPGADGYEVVKDSPFNRRIHHNTPMTIAGPAAGHDLMKTEADPTGTASLGTMNNCGSGRTPWGTYLTCEENFNGYFGSTDADAPRPEGYDRYGIGADGWGYDYHKHDARFDYSKNPNEPHRVGWVVEIDPTDASSTPVKHTGLGRFKHENAACALAPDGRVVVYMGDDERGEFMYKFVSNGTYAPGGSTEGLLDDGTLFAASFNDDGTGEWLPLTPESTGMASLAEVLIFARIGATTVGATTMDRPEWIAVNPHAIEAYCCLTNNSKRGGSAGEVNAPNPRESNNYGQIVRWRPHDDDHASNTFDWDLYVMAGNPDVYPNNPYGGSENVTAGNMFNSPDGMMFDSNGLLWIQTDGDDSNEEDFAGMGNNQMLVGDPMTGEIARFLTGPKGCEVTGLCWSADRRTMFVGIQHPGGSWPDGSGLPRSAIIQVTRDDGALIG